ncbi:hypothetical protein DERP_010678 [Dermatophagoides pteronyssinus]|uniref:Uncharacterized protein n=1 Tax=Dermatophagoides pteronyssinus TaxID=6956 RepID=A0ABQ8JA50_DERPT|nr:hypothetical protein DERP_010678 [Dermatophagoides pteronyssinus]
MPTNQIITNKQTTIRKVMRFNNHGRGQQCFSSKSNHNESITKEEPEKIKGNYHLGRHIIIR